MNLANGLILAKTKNKKKKNSDPSENFPNLSQKFEFFLLILEANFGILFRQFHASSPVAVCWNDIGMNGTMYGEYNSCNFIKHKMGDPLHVT